MADEAKGKSIGWVVGMLMLAVLGGSWVYAAGDYFQHEGDGPRRGMFMNALMQIPNAPAVIGYVFKNRIWLAIAFGVAEVLVLGLGVVLKRVENELNGPRRPARR